MNFGSLPKHLRSVLLALKLFDLEYHGQLKPYLTYLQDWANSAQAKEAVEQAKGWFTRFIEWIKSLFN